MRLKTKLVEPGYYDVECYGVIVAEIQRSGNTWFGYLKGDGFDPVWGRTKRDVLVELSKRYS